MREAEVESEDADDIGGAFVPTEEDIEAARDLARRVSSILLELFDAKSASNDL